MLSNMRIFTTIIVGLSLFGITNQQKLYDETISTFCKKQSGEFTQRDPKSKFGEDICKWNVHRFAKTEESARKFCTFASPFPIDKVTKNDLGQPLCVLKFDAPQYGPCDAGFETYVRDSGQVFCHKLFNYGQTYKWASNKCREYDAYLSGFESYEELKFLTNLASKHHASEYWLGGRRKAECLWDGKRNGFGYSKDVNDPCSRNEVFEWQNGVASNYEKTFADAWCFEVNPSYSDFEEECLELYYFHDPRYDGSLNDDNCDKLNDFICGKSAPILNAYT